VVYNPLEEKQYLKRLAVKDIGYGKSELSENLIHLALGPNAIGRVKNYIYRNKFYNVPRVKSYLSSSRTVSPLPLYLLKQVDSHWTNQKNLALFPLCLRMKKSRIGDELLHRFGDRLADLEEKDLITMDRDYLNVTDLGISWSQRSPWCAL
jgi:coproporphyrinogen III oxidase-like Fe-S oxidoreductase